MMRPLADYSMDAILYAVMNWMHWQLRHDTTNRKTLEAYLDTCAPLDRPSYFAPPLMEETEETSDHVSWKSPIQTPFDANNRARALFFPAHNAGTEAPTLIILHALMSASDGGYRRIAARMNKQGWNVLFPHLPFHYSRSPEHHVQGSLAITTDLVRNGETLRQAVQEIRQLMAWSRARGSTKMGFLSTSYGGWIASLILSLEKVDFALLLQPITEINYATFKSPLARVMAALLTAHGITSHHLERHAHLTAPLLGMPQCAPERIIVIGGTRDRIAPPDQLQHFCRHWNAVYDEVEQGHYGYRAMERALIRMDQLMAS